MAQTREHLAILQLTGNPMLAVALIKADCGRRRVISAERQVRRCWWNTVLLEAKLFIIAATACRGIDVRAGILSVAGTRACQPT